MSTDEEAADPNLISEAGAVLQAMAKDGIRISDRAFERYVDVHLAEFDRRGTELRNLRRFNREMADEIEEMKGESYKFAELSADLASALPVVEGSQDDLAQADGKVYSLSVDLARALPVVEAAEAYIVECENPAPDLLYRAHLRAALARSVRAAREPRTGEQG